ncbi:transglutaminase domain-containing protein [Candidatus Pacearchaeota archaeon]|nr:transglutaminase domain-containing protein [Candidatus Pacearchaeota archaeon]
MKKIYFIIVLFIFLIPTIYAEQFSDYQNLVIKTNLYGKLTASGIGKLAANLSLLPEEDLRQQVTSLKTFPPTEVGDTIFYSWNTDIAEFGWNATVKTNAVLQEIKRIRFPITINEYLEYKATSEHININDDIRNKANELVSGKTDLFDAIHEIGNFVYTNLTYDKDYVDTVEKASWVLENKKGVCDEYSILFIALVRSLGIPAKYVTGIVYSPTTYGGFFGNHAWAEVYMPGYGWIPFDLTFGQFGWIDSTHIALSKSVDSESSVVYTYQVGKQVEASELNISYDVIDKSNLLQEKLSISAEPIKKEIGTNSYLPLQVTIENQNLFYVPAIIYITKSPGEIVGKNVQNILLGPGETQTIFFILKIPDEPAGYIYSSNIQVIDQFSDFAQTTIKFSDLYEPMSLSKAKTIAAELTTTKHSLIYDADITCTKDKESYYRDELIELNCKIMSQSNTLLQNLNLCILETNECKTFNLPINSEIEESFTLPAASDYLIKLSNAKLTKSLYLTSSVLEKPDLEVMDIKEKTLDYKESSVTTTIKTKSICNNLKLNINNKQFEVNSTEGTKEFVFDFPGKNALKGQINISAECFDLRDRIYKDEKTFNVQIENIPWYGQIVKFFMNLF